MNILLDTNILLYYVRINDDDKFRRFINPDLSIIYVFIVSFAEAKSIAFQNNWGKAKLDKLNYLIQNFEVIDVNDLLADIYVQIDAYSQRRNAHFETYPFDNPRNMGKNDLWIAATATLLNLTLITTDNDFDHLHQQFHEVRKIDLNNLRQVLDLPTAI
ncbi:MAG: PIN domain-containing protein [Microscillaceae bacterium]|jgi:tRNA(fMet)-specific endonuclease VapC|nr:PIN domain-containing protein [Microscillaceae bacterium]